MNMNSVISWAFMYMISFYTIVLSLAVTSRLTSSISLLLLFLSLQPAASSGECDPVHGPGPGSPSRDGVSSISSKPLCAALRTGAPEELFGLPDVL